MTVQDNHKGAAQQRTSEEIITTVQRPIEEEMKVPEPSQIDQVVVTDHEDLILQVEQYLS